LHCSFNIYACKYKYKYKYEYEYEYEYRYIEGCVVKNGMMDGCAREEGKKGREDGSGAGFWVSGYH
jgi:hypothetical protein